MKDSDVNKYLELMSKIEYKDKDNDRLYYAVTKTLYDNNVNDSDVNVKMIICFGLPRIWMLNPF